MNEPAGSKDLSDAFIGMNERGDLSMQKTATDIVIEVTKRCLTHEPADCDGCPFFSRKNCVRDRDLAVIDTLVDQQARIKELQAKLEKVERR